jgi:hypothetical protein
VEVPVLISAFRSQGGRTATSTALWIGGWVALAGWLISTPLIGLLVGIATAMALRIPRVRGALGFIAAALIVLAGVYITVRQGIRHIPANGGWPAGFGPAGSIVWAGVLFLGADGVVEVTLLRQARRHVEPGPPGGEDDASEERQVASSVS